MTIASNEPHAAVLAFPFGSHAPPLLAIVRVLAKLSPETHFSFFSTAQSNSSLFSPAGGAPNVVPCNVSDGVPAGYVFTGRRDEPIELFLNAARQNFRDAIATAEKECGRKVSCLITDAFYWFGADMAEEIGASWVAFWTAGSCSLSAHFHTDLMRETIGIGDIKEKEEESLKFVPGMSKLLVGDLPEGVVSGDLDSIFSRMVYQMGQTLPRADAVFINSFEELELPITLDLKSKFKSFLNIGPLNRLLQPYLLTSYMQSFVWSIFLGLVYCRLVAGQQNSWNLNKRLHNHNLYSLSFGSITLHSFLSQFDKSRTELDQTSFLFSLAVSFPINDFNYLNQISVICHTHGNRGSQIIISISVS